MAALALSMALLSHGLASVHRFEDLFSLIMVCIVEPLDSFRDFFCCVSW